MQLIILGMHRSGTSVLARLLNMMGAYFAAEGLSTGANQENPKGFWERRDVRALNDMLLHSADCDWNWISNFDRHKIPEAVLQEFRTRAAKIVLDMDAHRPWILKEPRLCLLFPLWRDLFEVPHCIHILRNPVEVAHSLKKRNEIPIEAGCALWEKYNIEAFNASIGLPRILVSHHQLMTDPASAVMKLYDQLMEFGIQGLRKPSHQEIVSFVRDDLYRERSAAADLPSSLNTDQLKLFESMQSGLILRKKKIAPFSESGKLALSNYEATLGPLEKTPKIAMSVETGESVLRKQLAQKEQEAKSAIEKVSKLEAALKDRDVKIQAVSKKENELQTQLALKALEAKAALDAVTKLESELKSKHELQMQLAVKVREARIAEDAAAKLEVELKRLNIKIEEISEKGYVFQTQFALKEQAYKTVKELVGKLETDLKSRDSRIEEASRKVTELQAQIALKEKEAKAATDSVAKLGEELRNQRARFQEVTKNETELQLQLGLKLNELKVAADSLEKYQEKLKDREEKISQAKQSYEKSNGDLKAKLKQREHEAAQLRKDLNQLREDTKQLNEIMRQLVHGVDRILHSRRWKLGHLLGSLRYKLLFRPVPLISADYIKKVKERYAQWSRRAGQGATQGRHEKIEALESHPGLPAKRRKVTVITWDITHNPLGRAYLLAESLAKEFDVEVLGPAHSRYGKGIWEPLKDSKLPINYFEGDSENYCRYFNVLKKISDSIDSDIIYISKPRMPSIILAVLAKIRKNIPIVIDVDDHELSFFSERSPVSLELIKALTGQEALNCLYGEMWTRYADGLIKYFDNITVSNSELQKKYGGAIIPHMRDESQFNPQKFRNRSEIRSKFGYTDSDKVILFIGTPRWHKGVGDIISALNDIGSPSYRLCIIGTVADEKLKAFLNTNAGENIKVVNNKSFFDLPYYLQLGDLMCILQDPASPISQYQMPAKFTDALSMGIPVVAYDVPPMRPYHEAGLVEFVERDSLSRKIIEIFGNYEKFKGRAIKNIEFFKRELSYGSGRTKLAEVFNAAIRSNKPSNDEFSALIKFLNDSCSNQNQDVDKRALAGSRAIDSGKNIVMFWKQNDTGIYGRRQDMFIKYLAKRPEIKKIIHFDYPASRRQLLGWKKECEGDAFSQSCLVYQQTKSRLNGRWDGDKVTGFTYIYEKEFDENGYIEYVNHALKENEVTPGNSIFWVYPRDFYFSEIAEHFKPEYIVCDVVDDHRAWPSKETYREKLTDNYKEILGISDLVFVNCQSVKDNMSEFCDEIFLIPNACEILVKEKDRWSKPRELEGLSGKIIGYVGNLDDARIDDILIGELASNNKNWQLVFIGSSHRCSTLLRLEKKHPNIHLLGVKQYDEAVKYIKYFDLAIIPHLDNELTKNMNPLKAYVYAALDIPILSTNVSNIHEMSEWLTVAKSHSEFVRECERLLGVEKAKHSSDSLIQRLYPHSWDERVDTIFKLLRQKGVFGRLSEMKSPKQGIA